jgi:hypothetical protein
MPTHNKLEDLETAKLVKEHGGKKTNKSTLHLVNTVITELHIAYCFIVLTSVSRASSS